MISEYCKKYRISKGVKQKELGNVKVISSFENGRSTNIKHLDKYISIAIKHNDLDCFFNGLRELYNDWYNEKSYGCEWVW